MELFAALIVRFSDATSGDKGTNKLDPNTGTSSFDGETATEGELVWLNEGADDIVGFVVGVELGCCGCEGTSLGSNDGVALNDEEGLAVGCRVPHKSSGGSRLFSQTVSLIQSYTVDTRLYTPGNS